MNDELSYDTFQIIKDNQQRAKGEQKWTESNFVIYTHMNPFRVSNFANKSANIVIFHLKFYSKTKNS